MADHDTHNTKKTDPTTGVPAKAGTMSGGGRTAIVVGAIVVLLLVLALLFLGGDGEIDPADVSVDATPGEDATVPADIGEEPVPDVTDVIEPGAADGGPDEPISLEENEAGTEADPAIGTDAESETGTTTGN